MLIEEAVMGNNMNVARELREIGKMISAASVIIAVRREVEAVMKEGFIVTDGIHHEAGKGYEVVVTCGSSKDSVARRLRASMPQMKIDDIATGVLGLKTARRGKLR
jgi:hypothetical protein